MWKKPPRAAAEHTSSAFEIEVGFHSLAAEIDRHSDKSWRRGQTHRKLDMVSAADTAR
jgi:hypothetical protein